MVRMVCWGGRVIDWSWGDGVMWHWGDSIPVTIVVFWPLDMTRARHRHFERVDVKTFLVRVSQQPHKVMLL